MDIFERLGRRGALALVALALTIAGCASHATSTPARHASASAETTFFRNYLEPDGRVVRHDQGSDTVSEGQAYAMLMAVGTNNRKIFATVWRWTRLHLQRPDGLLAWRWKGSAVADSTPAADADLDAAVALIEAADTFDIPDYRQQGLRLAAAVLSYESVPAAPGTLVVAGPWAVRNPAVLNPSYLVSGTAQFLAAETGDARWTAVAAATSALDHQLAASTSLAPDWATLPAGAAASSAVATGAPGTGDQAQYGLDAVRLIIRLATSCSSEDRALAAGYADRLGAADAAGARTLQGTALVSWTNPAVAMAVYAADRAAGRPDEAAGARATARAGQTAHPTYYGQAWIALTPLLFTTHTSETCS
jgi:endoglucanase